MNLAAYELITHLRNFDNGESKLSPSQVESGEILLRYKYGFSPERIRSELNKCPAARLLDLVREYQRLKGSVSESA